jgi:hypothetical protein
MDSVNLAVIYFWTPLIIGCGFSFFYPTEKMKKGLSKKSRDNQKIFVRRIDRLVFGTFIRPMSIVTLICFLGYALEYRPWERYGVVMTLFIAIGHMITLTAMSAGVIANRVRNQLLKVR